MTEGTRTTEQRPSEAKIKSELVVSISRIREARDRDYMTSDGQSDGGGTGKSDGPKI